MTKYGDFDCRRCGAYAETGQTELADKSYITKLCVDCRNDFDVFLVDHPTWAAYCASMEGVQMLYARTSADGVDRAAEVEQVRAERFELNKELRRICGNWLVETRKGSVEE